MKTAMKKTAKKTAKKAKLPKMRDQIADLYARISATNEQLQKVHNLIELEKQVNVTLAQRIKAASMALDGRRD